MAVEEQQEQEEQRGRIHDERLELLEHVNSLTEKPMVALGFAWLGLLILDFTTGLSPALQTTTNVIWGIFVVDFLIEFIIAPRKLDYLKRNWLTAISLMLPALRVFRALSAFRAARALRLTRAARGTSLVRLITSLNRGMRATRATLGRRGIGFSVGLTLIVLFAAAAGMWSFENPDALRAAGVREVGPTTGLNSYAEAVWWTAMMLTTFGSEYWPKTAEGRILGWLLSVFALAVFGYITANIATYFIGQDTAEGRADSPDIAGLREDTAALRDEIAALRAEIARLADGT